MPRGEKEKVIRNFYIKAVAAKVVSNGSGRAVDVLSIRLKDEDNAPFYDIFSDRAKLHGMTMEDVKRGLQVDVYYREVPSRDPERPFRQVTRMYLSRPRNSIAVPVEHTGV